MSVLVDRRRHLRPARRPSSTPTANCRRTCTTGRSRRRRRPPGWSSSTRRRWPRPCSTWPAPRSPTTATRSRGVGITTQRASTIVWDRATGEPVGPGLGWQDLRTVRRVHHGAQPSTACTSPPTSRPPRSPGCSTPTTPDRARDLCFGTVDTWIAWMLSEGAVHVTDASNAAVTGLLDPDASGWSTHDAATRSASPCGMLPTIVDSTGELGPATALPGAPPIGGIAGDQQASLVGQGCVAPGHGQDHVRHRRDARRVHRRRRPGVGQRAGPAGTFPIVAWRRDGEIDLGRRGDHAVGRHERRVAARRPRHHRRRRGQPRRRGAVRRHRRRRLRAGAARPRHAGLGLRRPRHAARPHPRQRPPAGRAGRARRRRPPRRRPGRRGRGRRRAHRRRCASTAA